MPLDPVERFLRDVAHDARLEAQRLILLAIRIDGYAADLKSAASGCTLRVPSKDEGRTEAQPSAGANPDEEVEPTRPNDSEAARHRPVWLAVVTPESRVRLVARGRVLDDGSTVFDVPVDLREGETAEVWSE